MPEKTKERIRLTYRQARVFREAYGDALPAEAAAVTDAYLALEKLPKLRRIAALKKGGSLMQSAVARAGQFIFV